MFCCSSSSCIFKALCAHLELYSELSVVGNLMHDALFRVFDCYSFCSSVKPKFIGMESLIRKTKIHRVFNNYLVPKP